MQSNKTSGMLIEQLKQHWFGIALTVVGGLVVVVGLLFWLSYENEKESKAASLYDEAVLVLVYQLPQVSTNAARVNEISQYVLAKLDSIRTQYPRTFSSMRARLLLGRLYAQSYLAQGGDEAYNQAIQLYDEVARMASSPFYKGLALLNKAQLLEHHADWQSALETYRLVARKYNEFYTPYTWISLGRVGEVMNDKNTAMAAYETVVTKYTNSSWYGLALGRLTMLRQSSSSAQPVTPPMNATPVLGQ
ncbi:tetratricopeptide repeat protein [Thermospira aquatica]|uniref:Tetratricopeptide repeat protein n=1 Tax=Thermospira aquatica TaxID=2828656 RepID=A0AAX3BFN5_9SPIR|nr:tetratricopeptide repeat protein [Thermospira aquatica]URA11197.1 tetratricopeptide repeat protein [Thermospira aquatica]